MSGIEGREEDFMVKNRSYGMRTTNMNMEHCLTDEGHDKRNTDSWDRTEWYNVQRQRSSNACINMKFV